jgi:endonuclease/exonuclease/phosphatase family metal-dependent hydrolase
LPDTDRAGPGRACLRIATLNIRNTADQWAERRKLLSTQLAELRPDVIGVQELRRWPSQARWTKKRLDDSPRAGPPYQCHSAGKTGLWGLWEGIAVFTRVPVLERGSLDLGGDHRVANWVRVQLADGATAEVYNAHLSARDGALRDRQAGLLLDHMAARGDVPKLMVGDLNATPGSSTLGLLGDRFRSAYAVVHGQEPARTWPTPLRPGAGSGRVLDYVLVDDRIEVDEAWVAFDRPAPTDPTLFPSDHLGIAATVSVRRR